jgi:site-specific recombinase XerD
MLGPVPKGPYRKPHAMRHSYATWMLEAGADLRYVKDQMGHASIEETEGTYGHLEVERHEQRVDLDHALIGLAAH